ncbi:conserved hypothetical protein (plasmid) [Rhizobium leguminosarum bv. trifolii WSM1325]|uniref:Damage-inducible mutagenesis protein n=1 Tax=Rhizobium leguminosarum bv. trifolii (strain WSM1325) TaxID=395491 RepID=C6BA93_RHILS|nr:conserved hypothetical protein [Rhizobium leguminosarum bv. trifolii WSM1325]
MKVNHEIRRPNVVLDSLREQIAQLESASQRKRDFLPFGVASIDERLPCGGLVYGALRECAGGGAGTVDVAAAALFVAGIAARTKGKVVWCLTRHDLFFPARKSPNCLRTRSRSFGRSSRSRG